MTSDLYPVSQEKAFSIDYISYDAGSNEKSILTFLTFASSRRAAEQIVRKVERGCKITIIKIKSFENSFAC